MKTIRNIVWLPRGTEERYGAAHQVWLLLCLTGLGCCIGILTLCLSAAADSGLAKENLFQSFFAHPLILTLNLLPPVLLVWGFYFLSRRPWAAFLAGYLPTVGLALVNFYKIRLRATPLLAEDLRLAWEAGHIVKGYTLEVTLLVKLALLCLPAGLLFALLFLQNGLRSRKGRLLGSVLCLGLLAGSIPTLYANDTIYDRKTENYEYINRWSELELYISKGFLYPFLHSTKTMFPPKPEGYHATAARELLDRYPDADIPEEKKVSVMGIMLEAFCDLTDFDALSALEEVQEVYAPWHTLEEQSVSGNLVTNVFAGGTVDTEWSFLTGSTETNGYRKNTDSYVRYLRDQGYRTFGSHPGFGWFYNRQNVNRYLGFSEYWFTENHYGELVDPVAAQFHSDGIFVPELLKQLKEQISEGPCFSFSVSYQNHGPYSTEASPGAEYVSADTGWSEETRNIFTHYLRGIRETTEALLGLIDELEEMEEPVVLVIFGDHKPWAGNGNSAYGEIGADFDLGTKEGFTLYYAAPYLIWANSAAKEVLGNSFVGEGGDFSPCFLMQELFDRCGWQGPGFMELSRQVRELTPLVHTQGRYLWEGELTDALPPEAQQQLQDFLCAQYCRENGRVPSYAEE